jgi:hypothetical protein
MAVQAAYAADWVSFADRALRQLDEWPALQVCRADCGAGMGVAVRSRQIVHLHRPDEAERHHPPCGSHVSQWRTLRSVS